MSDNEPNRRRFLTGASLAMAGGIAGCIGGGSGSEDSGNDPLLADNDEFDPASPGWEDNNYRASALFEAGYERGTRADLERMSERDVDGVPHGDPPREPPEDESEWIDPDTLVFTESPSEDREATYRENLRPLIDRLAEVTGKDVEFMQVQSYAASVEAMRSEQAHIANFSTGTTAFAVNLAGAVPFAVGIGGDGAFGYRLFATTRVGNGDVQSVEDFADDGVDVAHAEPASNSGHQAPSALFNQEFDVTAGEDYEIEFSGGHSQTTRGIDAGDYDAGPICSTCMQDTVEGDGNLDASDFKVVWASDPFPSGPIAYRYNLHPDLVEDIKTAWIETDWSGTSYEEVTDYAEFVPIDYAKHWRDIMVIQRYNDVEYTEGSLSE